MLSEQDIYEQLQQMLVIEIQQQNHFSDLLTKVENKTLRRFFTHFVEMETRHVQLLEDLIQLYDDSEKE